MHKSNFEFWDGHIWDRVHFAHSDIITMHSTIVDGNWTTHSEVVLKCCEAAP